MQLSLALIDFFNLLFSREIILYLVFGFLTTLVNLGTFTGLSRIFGKDRWYLSNAPAIFLAILFAFVTNRAIVFQSTGPWLPELFRFFAARIFVSLVLEYGGMYLIYNIMKMKSGLKIKQFELSYAKLLVQILVVVGNYVISKWFIFTGING
jgi:putative flippase GtrA